MGGYNRREEWLDFDERRVFHSARLTRSTYCCRYARHIFTFIVTGFWQGKQSYDYE